MKAFNAKDYDILPQSDITLKLCRLLESLSNIDGEKVLTFEKGTYYLSSKNCKKYMLHITNTVGDKEFSSEETPHLNAVPFYLNGVDDLVIDGNHSLFIIDGKVTNIALENCRRITLKNMEIRHRHPNMHELEVTKIKPFYVDFKIDGDTRLKNHAGKLCFFGRDYCKAVDENADISAWIGLIKKNRPNKIERVLHPLAHRLKLKRISENKIRAYYLNTARFEIGDCFYIFDVRRQFAGIFLNSCDNITLENIGQRFNYSLALVAQLCENITVDSVEFAPEKGSARKMASVADFIQICMCKGDVIIKNSLFDGAGDDCINVHGIHFKITKADGNTLTVRFMHPQTHGFNPFKNGDKIAYISHNTLLEKGTAVIKGSRLLNEYELELEVSDFKGAKIGDAIENITACQMLNFQIIRSTELLQEPVFLLQEDVCLLKATDLSVIP